MRFPFAIAALALIAASPGERLAIALDAYAHHRDRVAAAEFGRLALQNSAIAETMLGTMYAQGRTGAPDAAVAVAYWLRASQRGYPPAQIAFARALADGRGVGRDPGQAYAWALIAARRSDGAAHAAATALAAQLRPALAPEEAARRVASAARWRPWVSRAD